MLPVLLLIVARLLATINWYAPWVLPASGSLNVQLKVTVAEVLIFTGLTAPLALTLVDAVGALLGAVIVKLAPEAVVGEPSASCTLILQVVPGVFGIVTEAVSAVPAMPVAKLVGYVEPPFVESSIFTLPGVPVCVHVTLCDELPAHDSPPAGEVIVSPATPVIVKFALDSSLGVPEAPCTLMRQVALPPEGRVTDCVPSFAVPAARLVGYVEPPSVERSMLTFPVTFVLVHKTV
jgi:hypothetical protein